MVKYYKNGVPKRFVCHGLFRSFMLDEQEKTATIVVDFGFEWKKKKGHVASQAKQARNGGGHNGT